MSIQPGEHAIDLLDVPREIRTQRPQVGTRPVRFDLDDVQCEFVGPAHRAIVVVVGRVTRGQRQQPVRDGRHIQLTARDDHVFEFDADAFEPVQTRVHGAPDLDRSTRPSNDCASCS